jgi:hypothetical protein
LGEIRQGKLRSSSNQRRLEKKILVIGWILYLEPAVYFHERSRGFHAGKQGDLIPGASAIWKEAVCVEEILRSKTF